MFLSFLVDDRCHDPSIHVYSQKVDNAVCLFVCLTVSVTCALCQCQCQS